jgi:hypothetical protein
VFDEERGEQLIHHVTLEIRKEDAHEAMEFWKLLGYMRVKIPSGRRGGNHFWLTSKKSQQAIHLHPVHVPKVPDTGHVAILIEPWDRITHMLEVWGHELEPVLDYFGNKRAFVQSPGGHTVELIEGPVVNIFAGMPLEEPTKEVAHD